MQQKSSSREPTLLQQKASNPECSVFVSASAGTGKTKILCDRFIRLMLKGSSPEHILCLTFTNAAAAEMNERIKLQLKAWANQTDLQQIEKELYNLTGDQADSKTIKDIAGLYDKFKTALDKIKINTIHSFCLAILKQFSFLDKEFTVTDIIDDAKKSELIESSCYEVFNNPSEVTASSLDILTEFYDFKKIIELIGQLIIANKLKFESYISKFYDFDVLKSSIYTLHQADITKQSLDIATEFLQKSKSRIETSCSQLTELKEPLGDKLLTAIATKDLDSFWELLLNEEEELKARIVKKEIKENFPEIFECLKQEAILLKECLSRYKKQVSAEFNYALSQVAWEVYKQYEMHKTVRGFIEYDDLLKNAITLLKNSKYSAWVLYNLDYKIDHILVDESQDLSPLQWELIQIIADEFFTGDSVKKNHRTIFIVGDYKQSIYSFQGAEPLIFNKIKHYFKKKVTTSGNKWCEVIMNTSFRTTQPVLKLVDNIFNNPMYMDAVNLQNDKIEHIPWREGNGFTENWELSVRADKVKEVGWKLPKNEADTDDVKYLSATLIASNIAAWIKQGRCLYGRNRAILPSDIMILVRKRSEFTKLLTAQLKKHNIPVIDEDQYTLNDEIIFQDLQALGNFFLFPYDDLNLACLLKSPLIGFNEEDLFSLSYNRAGTLFDELIKFPDTLNYLNELRLRLTQQTLYQFYHGVLELDKKAHKFNERFGNKALEIIDNFFSLILRYEQGNVPSMYGFLRWLQRPEVKVKSHTFSGSDAVRIHTVHGAKGLQSPIVIMADAASSEQSPHQQIFWFDRRNKSENIETDYWMFFSTYKDYEDDLTKEAKDQSQQKQNHENLRLLYVALTRAEDELYVTGWENNKSTKSWYNIVKDNSPEFERPHDEFQLISKTENIFLNELPDFLNHRIQTEKQARQTVTKGNDIQTQEMLEGQIIHELLQNFPRFNHQQQASYKALISQKYPSIDTIQLVEDVEKVMGEFPFIFTKQAMREVPIIGKIAGNKISARVDCLLVDEQEIKIIDFKSDKLISSNKEKYQRQLNSYKELISKIYPDKAITCYLLWVRHKQLENIA